jgi:endo-1,4-beta-mannosidase
MALRGGKARRHQRRKEIFYAIPYTRDLDKARLVRSNVIRIFLNVDQWGGVRNIYGQPIPFNTRLLTALDQFLWQANEWDMKVIVTFYDGLNTPTSGCTGKLGNRYNSGWSEAQPYLELVQRIVDYFKNDVRIAAWDVMNEPDHLAHMHPGGCSNTQYDMGWLTGWMQRVEHLQLQPFDAGDSFQWRFYHLPMSKRLTSGSQSYFEFAFKPRNNVYIHADPPAWGGSLGYSRKWIGPWETFKMECVNSLAEDPSASLGAN